MILCGIGDIGKVYVLLVFYWVLFIEFGCGFYDVFWWIDWLIIVYVNNGFNGCVNMYIYDVLNVFNDLLVDELVVIY